MTGLYTKDCVFIPEKNQATPASIMYNQGLDSVSVISSKPSSYPMFCCEKYLIIVTVIKMTFVMPETSNCVVYPTGKQVLYEGHSQPACSKHAEQNV